MSGPTDDVYVDKEWTTGVWAEKRMTLGKGREGGRLGGVMTTGGQTGGVTADRLVEGWGIAGGRAEGWVGGSRWMPGGWMSGRGHAGGPVPLGQPPPTCRNVLLRSSVHVILPDQDLLTV